MGSGSLRERLADLYSLGEVCAVAGFIENYHQARWRPKPEKTVPRQCNSSVPIELESELFLNDCIVLANLRRQPLVLEHISIEPKRESGGENLEICFVA